MFPSYSSFTEWEKSNGNTFNDQWDIKNAWIGVITQI